MAQRLQCVELDFRPTQMDGWMELLAGLTLPQLQEAVLTTPDFHLRLRHPWRDLTACWDTKRGICAWQETLPVALSRLKPGSLDRIDYARYGREPEKLAVAVEGLKVPTVIR